MRGGVVGPGSPRLPDYVLFLLFVLVNKAERARRSWDDLLGRSIVFLIVLDKLPPRRGIRSANKQKRNPRAVNEIP